MHLALNAGEYRSDDPKDPVKGSLAAPVKAQGGVNLPRNEHGLLSMAQVDHIKPQKDGGSNSYCNAQIVSMALNQIKKAGKYPK
jgi:5-methylcytosine-specific restriction endonuclease McrA